MSFNSTTFVVFFVGVFFAYWALSSRRRARNGLLLAASCVFYGSWDLRFLALIGGSAVLDWFVGGALHRSESPGRRKALLLVSLTGNLGALAFFKYFNFFAENLTELFGRLGLSETGAWVPWGIVLPVGISFYTFQTLSYTLDIYRRQLDPAKSFPEFALFVAFFPQLVAGPIVRAREFLPQLERESRLDDGLAGKGLWLIACGMVKKVVLADTIGIELVEPVFRDPAAHSAGQIVVGVWGALFQFYLDFSAYSDIAIGAAACLGFVLPLNFDRPFLAQSFGEFWRRWHITLSTFVRDYVFFPLGGTRAGATRRGFNVLFTMFLMGLWHGAGWNYVIWGLMHGVLSLGSAELARRRSERKDPDARPLWERVLRRAWIFNLVALSMLFFRNGTLAEGKRGVEGSLEMLRRLGDWAATDATLSTLGLWVLAVSALIHFTPRAWVDAAGRGWLRVPSLAQAALLIFVTGALAAFAYQQSPFIYFQF